jgi:hypothetical protein
MLALIPAPALMPAYSTILDDLGRPSAAELAHALGVPVAAVRRWARAEQAPRSVALALFWLTRWGRSQLDTQLFNEARLQAQLADALRRELAHERERMARLLAAADFGSANSPVYALG